MSAHFVQKVRENLTTYQEYRRKVLDKESHFSEEQITDVLFKKLFSFQRMQAILAQDFGLNDAVSFVVGQRNPEAALEKALAVRTHLVAKGYTLTDANRFILIFGSHIDEPLTKFEERIKTARANLPASLSKQLSLNISAPEAKLAQVQADMIVLARAGLASQALRRRSPFINPIRKNGMRLSKVSSRRWWQQIPP